MKTSRITLGEVLQYDPDFEKEVDKIKNQGGVYISDKPSGDYGTVFLLNGKAVKVTTDSVELEHAQKLKGKKTNNFAFIYDVEVKHPKLGIITMEVLAPLTQEIPEEWIFSTEKEAKRFGIDPDELDFVGDNVMQHPKSGKLKMIDV
tara:strand:+ start:499 stop:939 length:441 start_codon:yes stop_codon:yes gene_type:complete